MLLQYRYRRHSTFNMQSSTITLQYWKHYCYYITLVAIPKNTTLSISITTTTTTTFAVATTTTTLFFVSRMKRLMKASLSFPPISGTIWCIWNHHDRCNDNSSRYHHHNHQHYCCLNPNQISFFFFSLPANIHTSTRAAQNTESYFKGKKKKKQDYLKK